MPHQPEAKATRPPEGDYVVGKGRTPESGKFRVGDGRPRGRRPKGTLNLETDIREELQGLVTVSVNGKSQRVSKQRSLVMRLVDNAARGHNGALKLALEYGAKFETASKVQGDAGGHASDMPHIDRLSIEELQQLGELLSKACGEEPPTPIPDPFAYIHDPDDARNYLTERTVDGLIYRRSLSADFQDQLIGIENGAYRSPALPRRPGCNRRQY